MLYLSKKRALGKLAGMISIVLILILGVHGYAREQNLIENFHGYYLKSYFYAWRYQLGNIGNHLFTALDKLNDPDEANGVDTSINAVVAQAVPVLVYHGIVGSDDGANITLANFWDQMLTLKKAGYQTVSVEDFYSFVSGKKELPVNSFLLTFDDGRKDSYYPVEPIMRALDYQGVIYLITRHSFDEDSRYYLHQAELEKMRDSGHWNIQAHAYDGHEEAEVDTYGDLGHYYSNRLYLTTESRIETEAEFEGRIGNDFLTAREELQSKLGIDSISFAYPYGDFGQNSINVPNAQSIVLERNHSVYPIAFYQVWGGMGYSWNYEDSSSYLEKRISVDTGWDGETLLKQLEAGRPKELPYRSAISSNEGWTYISGKFSLDQGRMSLQSDSQTTVSSVFLDGSYLWHDYSFKALVNWQKGRNISLVSRFQDDANHAACEFTDGSVHIEQKLAGKDQTISETVKMSPFSANDLELSVRVSGNHMECIEGNRIIVATDLLSSNLGHGGIGFKTWDAVPGNSELIVQNVDVDEG